MYSTFCISKHILLKKTREAKNKQLYVLCPILFHQRPRNVLEKLVEAGLIAPPPGIGIPPGFETTVPSTDVPTTAV